MMVSHGFKVVQEFVHPQYGTPCFPCIWKGQLEGFDPFSAVLSPRPHKPRGPFAELMEVAYVFLCLMDNGRVKNGSWFR